MRRAVAIGILLVAGSGHAAQGQVDSLDRLKVSIDLGLVATSGNSSVLTLSASEKVEYLLGAWTLRQGGRIVSARASGVETANEYGLYVQPEHRLSSQWRYYILGSWDGNKFLGIEWRYQEGLGVTWFPLQGPRWRVNLEAGFSFFQQQFTDQTRNAFPSMRAQLSARYNLTDRAYAQEVFVYLPNLAASGDYRINSDLSIVAPLMKHIALKASWLLQYQSRPLPGFVTTDNLYTTGLQLTF